MARGYAGVVPNTRLRLEDDHATKQIPERTVSAAAARRYSDLDARTTSSRPGYSSGGMVKREHSHMNCADLRDPRLMHGLVVGQDAGPVQTVPRTRTGAETGAWKSSAPLDKASHCSPQAPRHSFRLGIFSEGASMNGGASSENAHELCRCGKVCASNLTYEL